MCWSKSRLCFPHRNLYFRRRPWCHVWRNRQLVWEYCDVPRCSFESRECVLSLQVGPNQSVCFISVELFHLVAPAPPSPAPTDPEPGKLRPVLNSARHIHTLFPSTVSNVGLVSSPSCGADMRPAQQTKADEDRGWNSCHCGIPPVGRRRILAQQIQGEGFPLRGQPDLILLGPHSCPLLP